MSTGTGHIRFWNAARGYGFLIPAGSAPDDKASDVFLHVSTLHKADLADPLPGQLFEFDVALDARGRRYAASVKPVAGGTDA
jgi:cold shock CspA family protein